MLNEQTLEKLHSMKLFGMADAFRAQIESAQTSGLSFEERFALLVDEQWTWRENRALARRLRAAKLKERGVVEDIIALNEYDLEGAINRLLAHSKLNNQPVTLEMAEREVRDLIRPQEPKRIKIEDIQRVVARQYNVSRSDLLSSRRTANVVRPRQVAMYLAKTLTLRSLPEIGRRFGGRDHTTVLHAVRKIEALVARDTALSEEVESLKRQLQE